ncbi:hypothetical protein [Kribbella sp. CA-294648]|uniref:hypothetical protein n=1 Tax=Kribbella sp. CA-294648 TaxID=3239948 RepID=UPI003D8BD0C6
MTDEVQGGTEWVPRFGMLEVPAERAALIRGLFELAAFVADHPELPLPSVDAGMFPREASFSDEVAVVDRVAAGLGVTAGLRAGGGQYTAAKSFGPVRVYAMTSTPEHQAAYQAHMSYKNNVRPSGPIPGGAR